MPAANFLMPMEIAKDSATVAGLYASCWLPTIRAAELALHGKAGLTMKGLVSTYGVFPALGPGAISHPVSGVGKQIFFNVAAHEATEAYLTKNPMAIATVAAAGASLGTRKIVKDSVQAVGKSYKPTPANLAIGFSCEVLREVVFNRGCVNGADTVQKYFGEDVPKPQAFVALTALAMLAGAASGVPNFFALLYYGSNKSVSFLALLKPGDARANLCGSLFRSMGWRGVASATVFGLRHAFASQDKAQEQGSLTP